MYKAQPIHALNLRGRLFSLQRPRVMGIINLTPDSFFAGSRQSSVENAVAQAEEMVAEGVDILDLGAVSTRPGAVDVGVEEELARLLPPLEAIRKALPDVNISVDTFRAEVARRALETGADIINDITAGRDLEMFSVVAGANAPYVMMHMRGTPQTMAGLTEYEHLILEIQHYFLERITFARAAGVGDIVLDPGLGFAKTIPQNFEILQNLEVFQSLGCPLLIGLSRKSMIWKTLEVTPDEALNGTTALHMAALMGGACILRVHDVKEAVETIKLFTTLVDVPV